MKKYAIKLNDDQRQVLEEFAKNGVHNTHLVTRAKVILALDRSNNTDRLQITRLCKHFEISRQAIYDIIDAFLGAEKLEDFLKRKERDMPPNEPKVTGEIEAHIIALACSEAPKGCARWTLMLLANKCVELGFIGSIFHTAVQQVLKKRNISLI